MVHLSVFTPIWVGYRTHLGGPNHTYFITYDRAYGRLRPFIILHVLHVILAFAGLEAFSVVFKAFGGYLGRICLPLGGLSGALGGF